MAGIIRLGELEWPVKEATILAHIMPRNVADVDLGPSACGISWIIDIFGEACRHEGEPTEPYIYVHRFLARVKSWHELDNRDYFWPNCIETDDPFSYDRPMIYLYDHKDICNCKVHFRHRAGNVFEFELFGEDDYAGPKLHIQTSITFQGANVSVGQPEKNDHGNDPEAAWERLGELLDRNQFSPTAIPTIGGWGAWFRFEPIA